MKNILLIDDEPRMLDLLQLYLEGDSYHCEKANDGVKAIERLRHEKFDLVLLDVMMPVMDGWEVCKKIREFDNTPIIMLTALNQNNDMIFGLKNGADDYITKPFDEHVLMARIEALVRRTEKVDIIKSNNLTLDQRTHQLRIDRAELEITPIEFNILTLFLNNKNDIFSRNHLIERIWGYNAEVDDRTADSHIRNLREKLRNNGFAVDSMLITVYGVGYKWLG
ncbi:response regulator transcription factor (plasmid) [Lactiplantibacillus plantarum]|uniref:response regulator transcription factor n=1 Tax=Lactobacillaceae TaxID=33958 RepID=UPI000FF8C71D|nr:response regulator transcription factor [Lactiplantibacillus plantarum]MCQ9197181.1 response regulator transcription factor [Pediococcus pentosaceus]QAS28388.1 response regulator transcription factor [Lactiplantibacillus plantarum]UNB88910.1 response regulator transcription factor [Lactiplantibacillus plantarum]